MKPGAHHAGCDHTSILAFLEGRFGLEPLTLRPGTADDRTAAFGNVRARQVIDPLVHGAGEV